MPREFIKAANVQAYDLIMLIVLAMATIFGAIKGFAWQVASIASVIVSYIVAYRFRFQVADMIDATPPWNQFLAMLLLYVGTSFVIWVGFRLVSGMIDQVRLKEFDRHLGAGFGFLKGLIYCLLITMFATSLLGENQQRAICQSRSGYYIAKALDHGMGVLPREIHDVVGPYLAQLDDKLKHGQDNPPSGTDSNSSSTTGSPWQDPALGQFFENGFSEGVADTLRSVASPSQDSWGQGGWGQASGEPGSGGAGRNASQLAPPTEFPNSSTNSNWSGGSLPNSGNLPTYPAGGYPSNSLRSTDGSTQQAQQPGFGGFPAPPRR